MHCAHKCNETMHFFTQTTPKSSPAIFIIYMDKEATKLM